MNLLRKLFNLRQGEARPVLVLFFFFFFVVAVSIAGKTARDTIFLNLYDKTLLPLMFVAIAIVVSILIPIYTRITKNTDKLKTVLFVNLISGGLILFFYFYMHDVMIPIFYVLMEVIVIITGLQLWGLAGAVFSPMQAKRAFPLLSAGGSLAAIVIGFGISPIVQNFGSDTLLLFTILFLVAGIFVAYLSKPYFLPESPSSNRHKTLSKKNKSFDSYMVSIAAMIGLSAIVSTLVDYQFKITASTQFQSSDLASFFGMYYAVTGVAGLFIQLFVVSRLLSKLGVLAGLLILPIFLLFGSTSFLILPGLISISAAKFSDQTFKFTVHSTASQLLWLPVPNYKKAKIKPVITGTVKTALEGVAGISTFFAVKFLSIQQLSIISIVLIGGWVIVTFFLKGGYIRTLETAIEKRHLDFSELKIDATDKAMVNTLNNALQSGEMHQMHFALELMEGLSLNPWKSTLLDLLENGSVSTRSKIISLAKDEPGILSDEQIISSLNTQNDLVIPSISVASFRKLQDSIPLLKELLGAGDIRIKAQAAHGLLFITELDEPEARIALDQLLLSENIDEQVAGLEAIKGLKGYFETNTLLEFLNNDSYKVRLAALDICLDEKDNDLIPGILNNIRSSKTASKAREVINEFEEEHVFENIENWVKKTSLTIPEKINLAIMLKFHPGEKAVKILNDMWNPRELSVCSAIADSLLSIAREDPLTKESIQKIDDKARKLAKGMYEDTKMLMGIHPGEHGRLLIDYINRRLDLTLPIILKLGVLDMPDTKIETYIHYIVTKDQENMPFLFELLDTIFTKTERQALLPLITPSSNLERVKTGQKLFPSLKNLKLDNQLEVLLKSTNPWESSIAAFYIMNEPINKKLISLVFEVSGENEILTEGVQYAVYKRAKDLKELDIPQQFKVKELPAMYSTLEKTLILKTVPLFQSIPGKDLARVAQIAEEVQYSNDENIFKEGDPGHSMYIIVDGEVLIHRDVKKIATLKKGECLGEMALLDQEPRSADATVSNEAILLKINQEGFYELMSGNLEIMRGILKLLTGRLRTAIA